MTLPLGLLGLQVLLTPSAQADPGRTLAGLTVGTTLAPTPEALSLRVHVDHGLLSHVTGRVEAGAVGDRVQLAAGPQLDLVDGAWWRLGLTTMPELEHGADWHLQVRAGLRADWLMFWGLCLTGRADRVQDLEGGDWDAGLGLSVRM